MQARDGIACFVQLAPALDEVGLDLLTGMLEYNPRKRISADEALAHPWFNDVQLPEVPPVASAGPMT